MAAPDSCTWSGVFPAATTQFDLALEVDLSATQKVQKALLRDGVHGLVLMGTVGEGNSLTAEEKRSVLGAAVEVSEGKVPVIAGVSEFTTAAAVRFARDAERIGADGLMVLPAMVYVPTPAELEHHFRAVAAATGLPIMLYNNPPSYRVNIDIPTLNRLADVPNIVSIKESAPDSRRFTDIVNAFGDRFVLFAGLDDIAFEGLSLGAKGWVSGLTNAFPAESLLLYEALRNGDLQTARRIYRWFMPLLHLDSEHDLVQSIKLAEQIMGRGSERVRPPRLPLSGERRAAVITMVERARDSRPRS
jgi:1-pyrroline-4-hydroxy-2-carboxylate deaminase